MGPISLLSNEKNPFFHITNIKTNIAPWTLTIVGRRLAVGRHHQNVTAPTIAANDVTLPHDHGWMSTASPVDTRYSTTTKCVVLPVWQEVWYNL